MRLRRGEKRGDGRDGDAASAAGTNRGRRPLPQERAQSSKLKAERINCLIVDSLTTYSTSRLCVKRIRAGSNPAPTIHVVSLSGPSSEIEVYILFAGVLLCSG